MICSLNSSTVSPLIGGYLSNPNLIPGLTDHIPYLKKVPFFVPFALIGCIGLICLHFSNHDIQLLFLFCVS